jgi:regulatory protein
VTSRPPRLPPAIGDAVLEKSALFYLERYSSSSAQLRRVLLRRVKRAEMLGTDKPEAEAARRHIETLVARFLASGLLDDRRFAEAKAASLQRRGTSRRRIRERLVSKGVERELVDAALETIDDPSGELAAACALARRRRLGPYRPAATRGAHRQKDLAALARAGFSLDLSRTVLAARDPEALERLLRESET